MLEHLKREFGLDLDDARTSDPDPLDDIQFFAAPYVREAFGLEFSDTPEVIIERRTMSLAAYVEAQRPFYAAIPRRDFMTALEAFAQPQARSWYAPLLQMLQLGATALAARLIARTQRGPVLPPEGDLEARVGQLERQSLLIETHFTEAFWKALDVAYEAILPNRKIRCIVCDYTDARGGFEILIDRCVFHGGKLERYRCPRCECIFGPMKYLDLDEAFVSRDYKLLYSRYSEGDSTESEIRTFHSLQPEPGSAYLDWGSGGPWSRTVAQLRGEGWRVLAYEPSAETAGDHVVSRRDALASRFDGIFSNNVIEHFRDPVAQFREFHDLLSDRGVMAHSSPCYEYNVAYTRFHTLFLTGKSLAVLAERTGFSIINSIRDGDYINYVLSRI